MEALNQSENNSTEADEVIDPITITVNAGASLSAPESASIARKKKSSDQQGEEQAKRRRQNHQCEYIASSERLGTQTNTC